MAALQAHDWPGNIRELRNVLDRALLLRRGPHIDEPDITFDGRPAPVAGTTTPVEGGGLLEYTPGVSLAEALARAERAIIESALKKLANNRERVARELDIARSTLFKRLKDWGYTQE
jgi:two-component system response regulator HydG